MNKEKQTPEVQESTAGADEGQGGIFFYPGSQYLKDLSYEAPGVPKSFALFKDSRPQIEMNFDIKSRLVEENNYEVEMNFNIKAVIDNKIIFLIELSYGGLFSIIGANAQMLEQILLINCPSLLFPFARRIVADITRDGGFLPLMLDPIDFAAIYLQRKNQASEDNKQ